MVTSQLYWWRKTACAHSCPSHESRAKEENKKDQFVKIMPVFIFDVLKPQNKT
jgi:hypothetical protein